MSKANSTENALLLLIFNATTWDLIAENDTTSPATNLYVALHTSDPGEAGAQNTNETAYTNYARVAVARSGAGWTVTGSSTANAALIQFPQCGVTGATVTHVSIGTASAGAGTILYSGALNSSLAVSNLIQPQFAAGGSLTVTED